MRKLTILFILAIVCSTSGSKKKVASTGNNNAIANGKFNLPTFNSSS